MANPIPQAFQWVPGQKGGAAALRLLDQTKLPHKLEFLDCTCSEQVCDAIACLAVRGAPAIGYSGAYAMALWALQEWPNEAPEGTNFEQFKHAFDERAAYVANVRPTAVNLAWAVKRCCEVVSACQQEGLSIEQASQRVLDKANEIVSGDEAVSEAIGRCGAAEFHKLAQKLGRPLRIETHCNTGFLAMAHRGTALSAIRYAYEAGDVEKVWVDETRPIDQGARLTAWELGLLGIPNTLICDNMAGYIMQNGDVDAVVVGADRVCANGDFANKIGTYSLAVLANHHGVPFYTAAPLSTFDFNLENGSQIVVEQRKPMEVRCAPVVGGAWQKIAPDDCDALNPAFDVTPCSLLSGIFTEDGIRKY